MDINNRPNEVRAEDIIYVDLCDREIDIMQDISLVSEDIISLTIQSFKEGLDSTINKLYSTIEFLKHELTEKNNIIDSLLKQADLLVEIIPERDTNNSLFARNSNPQETSEIDDENADSFENVNLNRDNDHATSGILITEESPNTTIINNYPNRFFESYVYQPPQLYKS